MCGIGSTYYAPGGHELRYGDPCICLSGLSAVDCCGAAISHVRPNS